eukprot:Colp12_sorted_trinity150504_noHs@13378
MSSKRPAEIKNKEKRSQVYQKVKQEKEKEKRERRQKRKREEEELGDEAPPKQKPRTIENTREADETIVETGDTEALQEEDTDELASYFHGTTPKILITTSVKAVGETYSFIDELLNVVPNTYFHKRKREDMKEVIEYAKGEGFTDVIVINEDRKKPNSLMHTHLPNGPTATYKLTSIKRNKEIKNHARVTSHMPELVLNNFNTRLGHTVGRMFAALLPQQPQFQGRRVITFHNQRDFIFFRHHRYIFKENQRVGLQEIGPRFTLKLRSLQKGTFDGEMGEFEWIHKRKEMDTSRRRFFL